jgi:hypothetical protein
VFKVARLSGTCVHSAKVFDCKLIAALSSSKCHFFGILRVGKRWLLWFASLLRSPRLYLKLPLNDGAVAAQNLDEQRDIPSTLTTKTEVAHILPFARKVQREQFQGGK